MSVISVPAFLFADRWGRRSIFLTGGSVIAAAMLVIGSLYATGSVRAGSVGGWLVIVGIYIFALAYVSTWAIVAKIYATEIHPAHIRATANALAQALNWVSSHLGLILPRNSLNMSTDTLIACKLLGGFHHSYFSREILFRALLPVRRLYDPNLDSPCSLHARD